MKPRSVEPTPHERLTRAARLLFSGPPHITIDDIERIQVAALMGCVPVKRGDWAKKVPIKFRRPR